MLVLDKCQKMPKTENQNVTCRKIRKLKKKRENFQNFPNLIFIENNFTSIGFNLEKICHRISVS